MKNPIKDLENYRSFLETIPHVEKLTGKPWAYLKVKPHDLETYRSQNFEALATATKRE